MSLPRILIIDDDPQSLETIQEALQGRYEVEGCTDPSAGVEKALSWKPDLAIVDVDMPGMNGFEVCEAIRAAPRGSLVAIVFLTSDAQSSSMQKALRAGADDYLTKPFRLQELLTRIEFRLGQAHVAAPVRCGNLSIDPANQTATLHTRRKEKTFRLTSRGIRVAMALLKNEGRLLTREQLLSEAWDDSGDASDRAVDLHVFRLRKLLREWDRDIESIYGKGYMLGPRKRR